jgi:hypothetical protein
MLRALICGLILAGCASSAPSPARKPAPRPSSPLPTADADDLPPAHTVTITCKSKQELRVLTNRPVDKGCEVLYDRNGEQSVAASAKSDPTHCDKVADRIRGNLERAGFSCERRAL